MSSFTFFFLFVAILALVFLIVNLILAPHNPYSEKISAFECGFHSFLQTRLPFSISFFIYALIFLLLDLEILLIYPYVVSAYVNGIYGLIIMLIFSIAITIGFIFELGKNALKIPSKHNTEVSPPKKVGISLLGNLINKPLKGSPVLNKEDLNNKRFYST